MTPAEFERLLRRRELPQALLLAGEDSYLRDRLYQRLLAALLDPEQRDFNLHTISMAEDDVSQLGDAIGSLPVFAPCRVVVLREVDQAPAARQEALLPLVQDLPESTYLVLVSGPVDKRRRFWKELQKLATMVECQPLRAQDVTAYARQCARSEGMELTEAALMALEQRLSPSRVEVANEITKLATYLGQRQLADAEDVAAVVSGSQHENIFALLAALGQRDSSRALRLLQGLYADGEAPLNILTMIVRHFRHLWLVAEMRSQGLQQGQMAKRLKVPPFVVKQLLEQEGNFSANEYRQVYRQLLETDLALKSGSRERASLELLAAFVAQQA